VPLRVIPVFLFLGFTFVVVGNAWGQQTLLTLEAKTGYAFPRSGGVHVDGALGGGLALTYGYRDRAVEFSVERLAAKVKGNGLEGNLIMLPILLNGYLRFHPYGRRWFPSVGAGFGTVTNHFNPVGSTPRDTVLTDALAVQAILGFEVFVIPKWSVAAQARYLYARVSSSSENGKTAHINLGGPLVSFGVKRYF
jgi:hypothetical protein